MVCQPSVSTTEVGETIHVLMDAMHTCKLRPAHKGSTPVGHFGLSPWCLASPSQMKKKLIKRPTTKTHQRKQNMPVGHPSEARFQPTAALLPAGRVGRGSAVVSASVCLVSLIQQSTCTLLVADFGAETEPDACLWWCGWRPTASAPWTVPRCQAGGMEHGAPILEHERVMSSQLWYGRFGHEHSSHTCQSATPSLRVRPS